MQRRGCQPFTSGHSYNACQCVLPALPPQTCCTSATDTVHLSRTFVQEGQLIVQKGQFTKGRGVKDYLQKSFQTSDQNEMCTPPRRRLRRLGGKRNGLHWLRLASEENSPRRLSLVCAFQLHTQSLVHLPQIQKTQRIKGCLGATHEVRILQKPTLVPCPRKQ
jgi:hypothetical protein